MPIENPDQFDPSKRELLFAGRTDSVPDEHAPFQIASVLIQARPENIPAVQESFASVSAVEFHDGGGVGKLIATIETRTDREMVEIIDLFERTTGVINVSLVYHQSEQGAEHA